jgi:aminopeptidase N
LYDSSNYTHPIFFPYTIEDEIAGAFDTISYEKAGNAIQTLYYCIGEESFRNALKEFYTVYANQSVNTSQFI